MSQDERAARYSDLFARSHDNASDCAYCPICSTIAVVRNTRPEVLDHLASAVRELVAAASILIDEAEKVIGQPESERAANARSSGSKVRRIDVG